MDAAVVGDRFEQPDDGLLELRRVPVGQQMLQERMLGLDEELGQGVGIGRVAGLRPLRLRHVEFVEEHGLQLFRRSEVDLMSDRRIGLLCAGLGLLGEFLDESGQPLLVHGDSGQLHPGEHRHERQLDLAVDLGHIRVLEGLRQLRVDFEQGSGPLSVGGHGRVRVEVERELARIGLGFAEVDSGPLGRDLPEFVGSGVGHEEVGRQRRVPADVAHRQPDRLPGLDLQLRAVEDQ